MDNFKDSFEVSLQETARDILLLRKSNRTGALQARYTAEAIFTYLVGKLVFLGVSTEEIMAIPGVKDVIDGAPNRKE